MIGESLEQHCLSQFNALRMTAFPDAYFEKDNDARSGSKGDFIFRESRGGVEFISIMFEMKNEADETATKHKNEDFLKELDKDRREKKVRIRGARLASGGRQRALQQRHRGCFVQI